MKKANLLDSGAFGLVQVSVKLNPTGPGWHDSVPYLIFLLPEDYFSD